MKLKRFYAKDFRNIEEVDITFHEGVNLLFGSNAQGKTNAIEGIYLFARGKSFRKAKESELIRFGCEGFRAEITFETSLGEETLSYAVYGSERKRMKNGYKIDRISDMIGSFRAVLFTPDHLGLVKDGPEERRAFLDVAICQCKPYYLSAYTNYKRALEQRNCLLRMMGKGMPVDINEVYAWSRSLAEYAAPIYLERRDYIQRLEKHARVTMREISDEKESLTLHYKSDIDYDGDELQEIKKAYYDLFVSDIPREAQNMGTLFGIGRDDMEILINGRRARAFASQGQQRSVVLALKLAEGEACLELSGEYPVFLFDDVLSELDERRRAYLLSKRKDRQIVITSCEKKEIADFSESLICVKEGSFTPQGEGL
ncbi:MAG: DNA replication/repair protein RecF [Clostridia bacterium]|nr:DNA replication/repair protein RecF [Clostridia bacterium]